MELGRGSAVVLVKGEVRTAIRPATTHQVEVAIIVIVTPGQRAIAQVVEGGHRGKEGRAPIRCRLFGHKVIAIEIGRAGAVVDITLQEQIGVAIIVIVTPRHIAA